jgi:hypothetical protein
MNFRSTQCYLLNFPFISIVKIVFSIALVQQKIDKHLTKIGNDEEFSFKLMGKLIEWNIIL